MESYMNADLDTDTKIITRDICGGSPECGIWSAIKIITSSLRHMESSSQTYIVTLSHRWGKPLRTYTYKEKVATHQKAKNAQANNGFLEMMRSQQRRAILISCIITTRSSLFIRGKKVRQAIKIFQRPWALQEKSLPDEVLPKQELLNRSLPVIVYTLFLIPNSLPGKKGGGGSWGYSTGSTAPIHQLLMDPWNAKRKQNIR